MSLIENLIIYISLCLFTCSLILTIIIIFNFNFNNYNNRLKILENRKQELIIKNKEFEKLYIILNEFYIKNINGNGYNGYKGYKNIENEDNIEDNNFSLFD
jgi:hypothetical protein